MYHYGIMREKVIQKSSGAGSPIRMKSGKKDIQTIGSVSTDTNSRNFTVKVIHYLEGEEGSRGFVFFFFF